MPAKDSATPKRKHIFSDASGSDGYYVGAFIVGNGRPELVELPGCTNSTDAELMTSYLALQACIASGRRPGVVHTDLVDIAYLFQLQKIALVTELIRLLLDSGAKICPDAREHPQYLACHQFANRQFRLRRDAQCFIPAARS